MRITEITRVQYKAQSTHPVDNIVMGFNPDRMTPEKAAVMLRKLLSSEGIGSTVTLTPNKVIAVLDYNEISMLQHNNISGRIGIYSKTYGTQVQFK